LVDKAAQARKAKRGLRTPMTNATSEEKALQTGSEKVFNQELVMAVANHIPLLVLGPLLAALVGYIGASFLTIQYTSASLLRIDRPTARSMEALVTSPSIADSVLAKVPGTVNGPDSYSRLLSENVNFTDTEPGGERPNGERLIRFEITHWDPRAAQAINSGLIDVWLEATRPRGTERANLEGELQRLKISAAANSKLIDQLQSEATKLLVPNSIAGELATPISALTSKRDGQLTSIVALENKLAGLSHDVVAAPPNLPRDPKPRRRPAIAILSGMAAFPLLLALVLLGRHLAPGRSAREVIARPFSRAT
jgi:hypothetical protein